MSLETKKTWTRASKVQPNQFPKLRGEREHQVLPLNQQAIVTDTCEL